MTVLEVSA